LNLTLNLTREPEVANWPAIHDVFIAKIGSFKENVTAA